MNTHARNVSRVQLAASRPTQLEERIAAEGNPERPATPEEIKLASASGKQLYADKTGDVGAALDSALALKRQLGRYHALTRPKMSPTKVYKCREHLQAGEDPFLLALYFNADFAAVANIANDILRVRAEAKGLATFQTIPTTVPEYLKLAEKLLKQREAQAEAVETEKPTTECLQGQPGDVCCHDFCEPKASESGVARANTSDV